MRILMVGAGEIVRKMYLPMLAEWKGVEIVGVTSRRAESYEPLAAQYRVPAVSDLTTGLDLEPDMVFVHSSTDTHAAIAVEAMERHIPVFVDKPLGYHLQQAEDVINTAVRLGVPLFVGFNRRFAPLYVEARTAVAEPRYLVVEKHRRAQWFGDVRETVFDDFIHPLDTLLAWCGQVARAELVVHGGETLIQAEADGLRRALMHRGTPFEGERLTVAGSAGRVEVQDLEQLVHFTANQATSHGFGSWQSIAWRRGFITMVETALGAMRGDAVWPITTDDLYLTHRILESLTVSGCFQA